MYTTKSRVQNFLMINIDSSFDSQITEWINLVKVLIDNYTGTTFEASDEEAKYYTGSGTKTLILNDDLYSLTKIEILDEDGNVDYTVDDTSEYFLEPANTTPKNKIILNIHNAPLAYFPSTYPQQIKITGDWGVSATVPDDIRFVTTKLVAQIIQEGGYDIGREIKSEKLGEYSITYQDIQSIAEHDISIKTILDHHRIIEV